MSKSRYHFEIEDSSLSRIDSSGLPVVDVCQNNHLVFQLGLNIKHKPTPKPYFRNLRISTEDFPRDSLTALSGRVLEVLTQDPTISNFNAFRRNHYIIQVQDPRVISLLEEDIYRDRNREAERYADAFLGGEPHFTEKVSNIISRPDSIYPLILFHLDPSQRTNLALCVRQYFASLRFSADSATKRAEVIQTASATINEVRERIDKLKEMGLQTEAIETELQRLSQEPEKPAKRRIKIPTVEELEVLERQLPEEEPDTNYLFYFSRIGRMPTTLYTRANKGYSPDIVSFRFLEPSEDFIQRQRNMGVYRTQENSTKERPDRESNPDLGRDRATF